MSKPKPHHYILSDLHLGHENILSYCRPWFKSIKDHDDYIIDKISKLKKHDSLWLLGDVAFTKETLFRLKEVSCLLYLIGGNHDHYSATTYLEVFKNIHGVQQMTFQEKKILFTHIPMHPEQTRWDINIHGHMHTYHVDDDRYINVCCEPMEFTPKTIENVINDKLQKWNTCHDSR